MQRTHLFLASLCAVLSLETQAQSIPAEDMDLASTVSVPAPPQPVPISPIAQSPTPSNSNSYAPAGDSLSGSVPSLAPAPQTEGQNSEHISLSARSHFTPEHPRVDDTVTYSIQVTWQDSRIPVLVLAPDSIQFSGLKCVDQSTRHEKNAVNGMVENLAIFSYTLVPTQVGPAKAASLKVRYTTGISGHEEAVFAPAAHIDILPARFGFLSAAWFRWTAGLSAFSILLWAGFAAFKKLGQGQKSRDGKTNQAQNHRESLVKDVMALRNRIGNGESRNLLNEMERLSLIHLRTILKSTDDTTKFDALLDQWLGQIPDDLERQADWERLRDLFRLARYAGGHKEPHELQDALRSLKRCLNVQDEL